MTSLVAHLVCILFSATSGLVLLGKVYGIADMALTVPLFVLPCLFLLILIWLWARANARSFLASALAIGFIGGLISTLAYDMTRLPFQLAGYLVFMTNSTYGMWITDAAAASRYTEVVGWLYHFSNGITFSLIYALIMRGQHWIWAVIYAFGLESIAIFSNFGQVFSLSGNYGMISIAYLAHVSYGIPIGVMAQRWQASEDWIGRNKRFLVSVLAVFFAAFLVPIFNPKSIERDALTKAGIFRANAGTLLPFMQRIRVGESIRAVNVAANPVTIIVAKTAARHTVPARGATNLTFPTLGIYQIYIETRARTQSSFVIVEPVGKAVR